MTSPSELREMHDDELKTRLFEAKEDLFKLRFQMATGQLDDNRRLRTVRHDIGRIYTILRERELGLSVAPEAAAAEPADTKEVKSKEGKTKEVSSSESVAIDAEPAAK